MATISTSIPLTEETSSAYDKCSDDLTSVMTNYSTTDSPDGADSPETHIAYTIGDWIWIYGSPILIAVGSVGNLLSVCVLQRRNLRRSTTMFYLTCLSVGDLCCLYAGLLRYWIAAAFQVDIRNSSNVSCKLHTFFVYLFLDSTAWILVSVTIDRCIAVSFPFKSKRICTMRRCRFIILSIFLVAIAKNIHFFWTVEVKHSWEERCDVHSETGHHFLKYIWPWIDFSTFCLIPFTIMIMCNTKIIHVMLSSQQSLKNYRIKQGTGQRVQTRPEQPSSSIEINQMTDMPDNVTTQVRTAKLSIAADQNPGTSTDSTPQYKLSSLTAMLLTVNCVFLITTSPVQVFLIGEEYWFAEKTTEQIAWYNFWWAVVNMLMYLNNTIHFFLYCLTGPKFREELKFMFSRRNRVTVQIERSCNMAQ